MNVRVIQPGAETRAAEKYAREDFANRFRQSFGVPLPTAWANRWWPTTPRGAE